MWVYSRGLPFLPIPPGGLNFSEGGWMDHLLWIDAWLNFPGLKVGKTFISILPF
jgi:hypothetical protein